MNDTNSDQYPTISQMSTAAVKFLKAKSGDEGFFIMIEVSEDKALLPIYFGCREAE